ncbi:unnamed protein product [Schistosoma turkestanicum]|nr:unnamed protein product [Schistosoma turkestanicum]
MMSCAQITIQEYILAKSSYTPVNTISTNHNNSKMISETLENQKKGEAISMKLSSESNEDVTLDFVNTQHNSSLFQCKCIQLPCKCHSNNLETPSINYAPPTELDSSFDGSRNKDHFTSITLADYFDALNKQSNSLNGTTRNLLPRQVISHYQMPNSQSHLSESSLFTLSKQSFDDSHNNELINEQINNHSDTNNQNIATYNGNINNNHGNEPSFPVDYFNYLKKRRAFLTDRLLSRYTELIKLLNEELELTGYPPANYLQHTHAYHEALEAFKRIHGDDLSEDIYDLIVSNDSDLQSKSKGRHSRSINFIPMRGSRLQETSFMLSPRIMRRASIKLSSSASCLLKTSHSSLFIEDLYNQNHGHPTHYDEDNSSQILDDPNNSSHFIKDNPYDTLNSTASIKKPSKESSLMQKLNKSIPLALKSRFTNNNLVKSNYDRSASSPSLCESGIFVRQTIETTTTTTTTTMKTILEAVKNTPISSSPLSSPSAISTNTTQPLSSQSSRIISIINDKQEICNPYNFKDIQQAISWLEVELNAVKNIMMANMKCADENKSNRTSRKAYKLAVKRNQETITNLQNQIHGLQMYTQKRELFKCSKAETTSSCNADHYMTNQSFLRMSSSSLSSPSCSCSPSSSLMSSEQRSIGQSTNEISSKINILKKYSEKFKQSSISRFSLRDALFTPKNSDDIEKISPPILLYHSNNNQRDLPQTPFEPSQLNNNNNDNNKIINKKPIDTLKQSSPSVSLKSSQNNQISHNSTGTLQASINLKETATETVNINNGLEDDSNYENIYEYGHQRDNNNLTTTKSLSPVPSSVFDMDESQSYNTILSTSAKSFSEFGTQTINSEGLNYSNHTNNTNGLDSNNKLLILNGNDKEDIYSWSDQSSELTTYRDCLSSFRQLSSDSSNKLKSNNNPYDHELSSVNTTESGLNENKHQQSTLKKFNKSQNSLLHFTKPSYLRPTLSSSSSWSSANSLCSMNRIGQRESTVNIDSDYSMSTNKVLKSSRSTHSIRSTPQKTTVNVEFDQIQSNGIKTPTSQTNYYLPVHQLHNNTNSFKNNTDPHYLPCEQIRSPVIANKTNNNNNNNKTSYYHSPVIQNRTGQSIQKVHDHRHAPYSGVTKQNKGLRIVSSAINLSQIPSDSSNHRRHGNHSPRVIERAKL